MPTAKPYTASEKSEIYNRMYTYIRNYASMHGYTATAQYLNTLAYSLTGLTSDKSIFTRIKSGKNGKTRVDVACDRLSAIWEEIAGQIDWANESPLPEYKRTEAQPRQTQTQTPKPAPRNQSATHSAGWDTLISEIVDEVKNEIQPTLDALIQEHTQAQRVEIVMDGGEAKEIEGFVHPVFGRVLLHAKMGHNIYLYGPAGTGKSVIAEQLAKALGLTFYSDQSLVSRYDVTGTRAMDGSTKRTSFTNAFIEGGVYCLDEMDNCESPALTAINTPLANGYITIDGVTYKAHPDFHFIGCGNTNGRGADSEYVSRNVLDAATLNRFSYIPVGYDPRIEEALSNNDSDLTSFAHCLRETAQKCGISILCTYRNIKRIAETYQTFLMNKEVAREGVSYPNSDQGLRSLVLADELLMGMDVGDIQTLTANMRDRDAQMNENVWFKALRALC